MCTWDMLSLVWQGRKAYTAVDCAVVDQIALGDGTDAISGNVDVQGASDEASLRVRCGGDHTCGDDAGRAER
jgi:hypothetical protein